MFGMVLLAMAYLAGVGPLRIGLLAIVHYAPLLGVPVVLFAAIESQRSADDRAGLFCETVASELRAGLSLRQAVESGAATAGVSVTGDHPGGMTRFEATVGQFQGEFPQIERELRATIETVMRSGGAAAAIFDEIGSMAIAEAEIAREVQTASAAARATAWFFVAVPLGYLAFQVHSIALESPPQRVTAVVGLLLFLGGLVSVILLMWRAR